jgi:predicted GTPase
VADVGHGYTQTTTRVAQYPYTHSDLTKVRLVDTPGFENDNTRDLEILQMMRAFLDMEYVFPSLFSLSNPDPIHVM